MTTQTHTAQTINFDYSTTGMLASAALVIAAFVSQVTYFVFASGLSLTETMGLNQWGLATHIFTHAPVWGGANVAAVLISLALGAMSFRR